ncbi:hypothetical protein MVEN_00144200 [Mycena venus]|uniref:Uncharacterized protein n=1 Tax=Mycena venus TaxID=2733690 RepID=A0A8H6Z1N4_9AGAR|nr:hypothetical protein MVEN_00144200 [Mycena venus]
MPSQPTVMQARLKNIATCLTGAAATVDVLADNLKNPALDAISTTTQSLSKSVETIKQNKSDCAQLLEETHKLLNAIILVYIKSETGAELAPSVLTHIVKFTKTLHQIHAFLEAQQKTSSVKKLFRQGEMSRLLKECKTGLQEGLDFFQIERVNVMADVTQMCEDAQRRHQEVLCMIETLYDGRSFEGASYTSRVYSSSYNSSNSISIIRKTQSCCIVPDSAT